MSLWFASSTVPRSDINFYFRAIVDFNFADLHHRIRQPDFTALCSINMTSRAGLRYFQSARLSRTFAKRPLGRRHQSADATSVRTEGIFQRLWNSPVGVKTVHFW